MTKLTIHQIAEREAHKETERITDPKLVKNPLQAAYSRSLTRMAQEVESFRRKAWASALADESPIDQDHPMMVELRDWLRNGRRYGERPRNAFFTPVLNEHWARQLFIADDVDIASETAAGGNGLTDKRTDEIAHPGERAAVARFIGALVMINYKPKGGLAAHGLIAEILRDIEQLPGVSVSRETIDKWLTEAAERIK